jgi:hypothetical protein
VPPTVGSTATRRITVAVAVVVVIFAVVYEVKQLKKSPVGGDPHNDIAQLQTVKTFDYQGGHHTTDAVTYTETPPAGGPHDPQWEDCGTYTQQIRNENGVHALEHGTVWITYRPNLPEQAVQTLQNSLAAVRTKKTILSPYPGLPAPAVVTVWNAQLDLRGPNDPRLPLFIGYYGDGHTAPEAAFASCAGGVHEYADPSHP